MPEAYAKAFTGLLEARKEPSAFARELGKILIYHHGGKFPGADLDSIGLWRDGSDGEGAAALAAHGLPLAPISWSAALAAVPAPFRAAAAMALLGSESAEGSFSIPRPVAPENRRRWLRRAGLLARAGFPVAAGLALAALLAAASALVLRQVVESKARTWAGELGKWDRFQERRAGVEARLEKLQGLLSRRTTGYASLQGIASLLPQEVWLEEWEAEAGPGGRYIHRLTGYALAEDRVPQFLARLEDGGRFKSVKLKSTEKIRGDRVEKETGIHANRKDLVRFQAVAAE